MLKQVIDLFFSIMVLVGSLYLWRVADHFPAFEKYKNIDSDFWPKIILATMGILAALILYQNIRGLHLQVRKKQKPPPENETVATTAGVNKKKMLLMGGLCIAYYWGLNLTGFVIATISFMWLAMTVIGGVKKIKLILFPVIFTGILATIFIKVLELSLPRGVGLFYQFSLLLY